MIVQNISTNGCPQTIVIGRRGTYDTMQIAFDLSYLIESYGSGTAVLAVKRSQDESAYPAVVTQEDSTLLWTVNETDTAYVGSGECQLMWYVEGGLAKTIIYPMVVMRDILSTAEEPPDGYENWIEHLTELGAETQQNAQAAAQSATEAETAQGKAEDAQHAAEAAQDAAEEAATKAEEASAHAPIIVNGYWYSWDATTEAYQNTNVKAEGRDGTDGFSPAITVTDITGGHRVTITDADGTHTIDVMNGTNGTDGDDGFSPTVTITTITGGHRVTITDKNGAHSFDVMDGEDGASDAGEVTYDKTATYQSGTVGAELADLSRQLSDVEENQIPELKNAISELEDVVPPPITNPILQDKVFLETSGYYYKTGHTSQYQWHNDTGAKTTEKIEIPETATHVFVYTNVTISSASVIQFWDSNNQIISDYGSGASSWSDPSLVSCEIPANAKYISYTSFTNKAGSAYCYFLEGETTLNDRVDAIEDCVKQETKINTEIVEAGSFYRDGTILSSSTYGITDYIPCALGDQFLVDTYGSTTTVYLRAFYDSNKNVLYYEEPGTGVTEGSPQTQEFTVNAYNAAFVRFSCFKNYISCIKKSISNVSLPEVVNLNRQSLDDALGAGINKGRFTNANNPDSFMLLHFSDIHGTGFNLKDISDVKNFLSDVLDDTLCTGDIMTSYWNNDYSFWDAATDGTILTCIGNHDVKANNAGGTGYLTNQHSESDLYNRYMAPYINGWNVEHSGTNLYYYKDYPTKKIRLIVLNLLYPTAEKTAEQNSWLATALAGAKTAGYGVVIGEHYYPVQGTRIDCTFSALVNFPTAMSSPENYMYNGNALTTYQATVQDFIDGGGNFVCWLCGHKHADYIVYHPSYPKQVFIGVGGALFLNRANETNGTSDMRRVMDTRSQNCMNVLSIDPTDKKIRVIRIGCDRDYLGRHRGTLVLDYSASPATVVYND